MHHFQLRTGVDGSAFPGAPANQFAIQFHSHFVLFDTQVSQQTSQRQPGGNRCALSVYRHFHTEGGLATRFVFFH